MLIKFDEWRLKDLSWSFWRFLVGFRWILELDARPEHRRWRCHLPLQRRGSIISDCIAIWKSVLQGVQLALVKIKLDLLSLYSFSWDLELIDLPANSIGFPFFVFVKLDTFLSWAKTCQLDYFCLFMSLFLIDIHTAQTFAVASLSNLIEIVICWGNCILKRLAIWFKCKRYIVICMNYVLILLWSQRL